MDKDRLFQLYEKAYFHELDMREKINSRLQIPIAIFGGEMALIAFMFRSSKDFSWNFKFVFFYIFLIIVIKYGIDSLKWFVKTLTGHTYLALPPPAKIEEYNQEVNKTYYHYYTDHKKQTEIVMYDFIYDYYKDSATENFYKNKKRSEFLNETYKNLIQSMKFLFISLIIFYFFGIYNKESEERNITIHVTNQQGKEKLND